MFSWHGRLDDYDGHAGLLTLDDGRALPIRVDGAFLRATGDALAISGDAEISHDDTTRQHDFELSEPTPSP
jgi:hypothetical protein